MGGREEGEGRELYGGWILQTLLRCRRQLVEEEEGIKLGRCVLPDKEGSRRLHEEQKRAAAERKRKNEEKKMKIEDGDGEEVRNHSIEERRERKKSGPEKKRRTVDTFIV